MEKGQLLVNLQNVGQMWGKMSHLVAQKKRNYLLDKLVTFQLLRSVADLNCCTRFCRPLPNHSANRPCCDLRCKDRGNL